MSESEAATSDSNGAEARESSGLKIGRLIKIVAVLGSLLIILLLVAALAAALTAAETWAPLVQIFRDVFLLIFLMESILLITAFAVFLLQASGFLIMLRTEIKPILDNARETTRLSKATAEFISSNSVDPLIQIKSFLSGLLTFLRELIRIRNLVTTNDSHVEKMDETQTP